MCPLAWMIVSRVQVLPYLSSGQGLSPVACRTKLAAEACRANSGNRHVLNPLHALRKQCRAPLAYGLCSSRAILSLESTPFLQKGTYHL